MRTDRADLDKKIMSYGSDIIKSGTYKRAFLQPHHHHSTVGEHSMGVAKETIRVCEFMHRHGIRVNERKAVRSALMHDLGLLGRDEKFKSRYETSRRHPIESLYAAREFEPGMDEAMKQAILRHMFPIFSKPPTRAEAVAVCIADKLASIKEFKLGLYEMMKEQGLF